MVICNILVIKQLKDGGKALSINVFGEKRLSHIYCLHLKFTALALKVYCLVNSPLPFHKKVYRDHFAPTGVLPFREDRKLTRVPMISAMIRAVISTAKGMVHSK